MQLTGERIGIGRRLKEWLLISISDRLLKLVILVSIIGSGCAIYAVWSVVQLLPPPPPIPTRVSFTPVSLELGDENPQADTHFTVTPGKRTEAVRNKARFLCNNKNVTLKSSGDTLTVCADLASFREDSYTQMEVTTLYDDEIIGALPVSVVRPPPPPPQVSFNPSEVELNERTREASVDITATPPALADTILKSLNFKTSNTNISYKRAKANSIVVAADIDAFPEGAKSGETLSISYQDQEIGTLPVFVVRKQPQPIQVSFNPAHIEFNEQTPEVTVGMTLTPQGDLKQVLKNLVFKCGNKNISIKTITENAIVLSANVAAFPEGQQTSLTLIGSYKGKEAGSLPMVVSAPLPSPKKVIFDKDSIDFSSASDEISLPWKIEPQKADPKQVQGITFSASNSWLKVTKRENDLLVSCLAQDISRGEVLRGKITARLDKVELGTADVLFHGPPALESITVSPERIVFDENNRKQDLNLAVAPKSILEDIKWTYPDWLRIENSGNGVFSLRLRDDAGQKEEEGEVKVFLDGSIVSHAAVQIRVDKRTRYAKYEFGDVEIEYPLNPKVHEKVQITIASVNPAVNAPIGTINVSLRPWENTKQADSLITVERSSNYNVLLPSSGQTIARFQTCGNGWCLDSRNTGRAQFPIIEYYDENWSSGTARKMSIGLQFNESGKFRIQARATFARRDSGIFIVRNCPESGTHDQQELPTQVFDIVVLDN